ncbi:MAG TPA: ATP-binding protein [Candidatus Acidoferrales bacterium]|nr:ATP-binding protein [Candidatus Acidoferrales bacterium]
MDVQVKLRMPSQARFLAVVRAAVGELGSVYGWPEAECQGVILAVDEAVANIIKHAYHGNSEGAIEVTCLGAADRLEFTLLDQGDPPDPGRICSQPLDDHAHGGRGTHLIRMIMDEVCYERVPGGNRLRLIKNLPAVGCTEKERSDA